ncbi:DUF2264 domain-containing protein [Kribbella sp. CA-247076]|uniref:DUF2264 domain-containing protein n=1 Tax=Kribbella sp. CA-247076 TaxID=3239941 RepID=UPI003D92B903
MGVRRHSQRLTDDDRELSPYTGWTHEHWRTIADRTLLALRDFGSPGHASLDLPGPPSRSGPASDGLEGFARSFLTAGFRLAGSDEDPHDHAGWYAEGLAAGADPSSPEAWPRLTDFGQPRVEAAAMAIALHESRRQVWDKLDDRTRSQVVEWMAPALEVTYPASNWLWFQNVTLAFLRSVGGPCDDGVIQENIATLDTFYQGDGWYTDGLRSGRATHYDWYNGWVMHLFSLWYCRMSGSDLLDGYRDRLRQYLDTAQHLVGSDGAPLHQGRSLVYRFATAAPFWAGAIFDAGSLRPGATRRLTSGILRWFVEAGAWDDRGLLGLGWRTAFPPMRQSYSGPGSPYWAGLGFAGLVLPPTHPVWTDREEPLRLEQSDVAVVARPPGWLISGTTADGIVRVVNHGTDHAGPEPGLEDPLYSRHGYSTTTAPDLVGAEERPDSQVAIRTADGRWSQRRPITVLTLTPHVAVSRFPVHFGEAEVGLTVVTASVVRGPFEVRIVRVDGEYDGESLALTISGYATCGPASTVRPLIGEWQEGSTTRHGVNAFGDVSVTPWVEAALEPGRIYAALVVLGDSEYDDQITAGIDGATVVVTWPDGRQDLVSLAE